MEDDIKFWLGFSAFPGIGPVRFRLLYEYFGSAKRAWFATQTELLHIHLGETLVSQFIGFRSGFDGDGYQKHLKDAHIGVITIHDPVYPSRLKSISDAPFLLYVRGKKGKSPVDLNRAIAIVGTRQVTPYGVTVTKEMTQGLVRAGYTIVSGLAYGVDATAHRTALDLGGQTVAVLGCGVDVIAPTGNAGLYWDIIDSGRGAVVSEMPLGLRPEKGLFVTRNRIISGLSQGVVVTEGAADSGTMITAGYAAAQGRDVFAVPGAVTSRMSDGPAQLIKNGAQLVTDVHDILDIL